MILATLQCLLAAMASIQSRLHDLSVRCDRFQSKYGVHSAENPDSAEAVYVTLRYYVVVIESMHVLTLQLMLARMVPCYLELWHAGVLCYVINSKQCQTVWRPAHAYLLQIFAMQSHHQVAQQTTSSRQQLLSNSTVTLRQCVTQHLQQRLPYMKNAIRGQPEKQPGTFHSRAALAGNMARAAILLQRILAARESAMHTLQQETQHTLPASQHGPPDRLISSVMPMLCWTDCASCMPSVCLISEDVTRCCANCPKHVQVCIRQHLLLEKITSRMSVI